METILKWRNQNEIPEIGRRILVLYADSFQDKGICAHTKINKFNEKLTFLNKPVIAWAYADNLDDVENSLKSEVGFNAEWIEKIHNNACADSNDIQIGELTFTAYGHVTKDCIKYVAGSLGNFEKIYSVEYEESRRKRCGVKNIASVFYDNISECVFEYLDEHGVDYLEDDVYDHIDYVFN